MDELSAILVTRALDGLAMRASAISQNIANANSPSYQPFKVSFEQQLRDAAAQGAEAARRFEPEFTRLPMTGPVGRYASISRWPAPLTPPCATPR